MINIDYCRGIIFREMEYRILSICKSAANVTINGFGVTAFLSRGMENVTKKNNFTDINLQNQ
jgi:hypothetical protein